LIKFEQNHILASPKSSDLFYDYGCTYCMK